MQFLFKISYPLKPKYRIFIFKELNSLEIENTVCMFLLNIFIFGMDTLAYMSACLRGFRVGQTRELLQVPGPTQKYDCATT